MPKITKLRLHKKSIGFFRTRCMPYAIFPSIMYVLSYVNLMSSLNFMRVRLLHVH